MFNFLFSKPFITTLSNTIVEKIATEVNSSLVRMNAEQNKKLDVVVEHLEKLRNELSSLDHRLTNKELKDKINYGQMQYKISSLQNDLRESPLNTPELK